MRLFAVLLLVGCSAGVGGADFAPDSEGSAGAPVGDAGEPAVGGTAPSAAGSGGASSEAGKAHSGGAGSPPVTGGSAGSGPSGGSLQAGSSGAAAGSPPAGSAGQIGSAGTAAAGAGGTGGGCPAFDCLTAEQCATPGHTSYSTAPVYDAKTKCFSYETTCYPADFNRACVPAECWHTDGYCI